MKPAFVDTCRSGMTCIEDYSDSTLRGMTPFYRALDELAANPRLVRIAYFGDSFIEADILTADLRAMLQERYGGCGVGFVTITSMTSGYRPTVRHSFNGWQSHSIMDSVFFDRSKQGISGHYFIPNPGAYVELRGQKNYASRLDTCEHASIFFYNKGEVTLSASVNKGEAQTETFSPTGELREMDVTGRIGSVRWKVESADSTLFYGLAMDGTQGIVVDNFSLRGSSGLSLRSVPVWMMREFNEQRPYDLIILQYGLNVATERGRNYDRYRDGMATTIAHLKSAFPQAGILVVSVGDREYKTEEGDLRTMPGIKNLVRYQQNLAADSGVAFWNMFEAMGGEGSMADMVHANRLWPTTIIRISTFVAANIWQNCFMRHWSTAKNSTTGGVPMKRSHKENSRWSSLRFTVCYAVFVMLLLPVQRLCAQDALPGCPRLQKTVSDCDTLTAYGQRTDTLPVPFISCPRFPPTRRE